MMSELKAEFRKLLSIRSTYLLSIFVWLVVSFISFYAVGWNNSPADLQNPHLIQSSIFGVVQLAGLIASIVAILILAHEYRYNTINYSLTGSNSRTKVLASKFITITVYSVIMCLISVGLTVGLVHAGAAAHGHSIGAQQDYNFWHVLGQSLFSVWGSAMAALIFIVLIRNLVGAIVALFVVPAVEQLSTLLLHSNTGYLPLTALAAVTPLGEPTSFSVTKSMIIYAIYLVVFLVIAWQVFLRRDAS